MVKPVFAVVGHPNKGKSSIVSTLTRQDAVRISEISGTTTEAQQFNLTIDGVSHYSLVDTPGFQRPRQVLDWLRNHAPNASERRQIVQRFVREQQTEPSSRFHDETELLAPILDGAGIIYVVDGSLPYSAEFEAEMTILQWTGQPRMALINPIGNESHIEEWQSALSQYFSVVRVFDPMTADTRKQLTILTAFMELHEPWRQQIEQTIEALQSYSASLVEKGAMVVVEHLQEMFSHVSEVKVPAQFAQSALQDKLKYDYQQQLRIIESAMRRQLQALFAHTLMQTETQTLTVEAPDLFDHDHWYLYGLDRQKIVALAASVGAAAGAVIDVGVGGSSLMAGALAGGLFSGVASVAATWKPERLKIHGVPLAGKTLTAGPIKELTFAYVLLGRSIDFLVMIIQRTHADRRIAQIQSHNMNERLQSLNKVEQVKLTALLQKAHKGLSEKDQLAWRDWIVTLTKNEKANG
ncbi:MAG: GTPase/DUF3482 domain-containing protein [Reinekea sp.]|jgi:hypothetical protein